MPVGPKSLIPKSPGVRLGRNCVIQEDEQELRVTISPYRGNFSIITYLFVALLLSGFLYVFPQVPHDLSPVDKVVIFLFTCLLTSWLYFIVALVAMRQIILLDADRLTVIKKMGFPLSRIQVGAREAHAIIIEWVKEEAQAPIVVLCLDREIILAPWLYDSVQALEVYNRLAHRLRVKRLRRRLRPVEDAESLPGTDPEWVLEYFNGKMDDPGA